MSTPDALQFIDLQIDERDPQDIYEAAIAELTARLPDWTPREGNIEVMLLEALAVEVAELVYATNQVPNSVVQVLLSLFGVQYDQGAPPTTTLKFNTNLNYEVTVPEGTTVRLDLPNEADPIEFVTDQEVTAPIGTTEVTVAATGTTLTSSANDYPAGTLVQLYDALIFVESVSLASAVVGGRDEEDDENYFSRGTQTLGRLTKTLVLPSQFESAALEEVYVKRAKAFDNYDSASDTDNNGPVGNNPGFIAVAVYGDGAQVSSTDRTALQNRLNELAMAALTVTVIQPTISNVNVTVSVRPERGWQASAVEANVRAALQAFLSPSAWGWSATVRRNELISVISSAEGVDFVDALTTPASDSALGGAANLVNAGTLNITVLAAI